MRGPGRPGALRPGGTRSSSCNSGACSLGTVRLMPRLCLELASSRCVLYDVKPLLPTMKLQVDRDSDGFQGKRMIVIATSRCHSATAWPPHIPAPPVRMNREKTSIFINLCKFIINLFAGPTHCRPRMAAAPSAPPAPVRRESTTTPPPRPSPAPRAPGGNGGRGAGGRPLSIPARPGPAPNPRSVRPQPPPPAASMPVSWPVCGYLF